MLRPSLWAFQRGQPCVDGCLGHHPIVWWVSKVHDMWEVLTSCSLGSSCPPTLAMLSTSSTYFLGGLTSSSTTSTSNSTPGLVWHCFSYLFLAHNVKSSDVDTSSSLSKSSSWVDLLQLPGSFAFAFMVVLFCVHGLPLCLGLWSLGGIPLEMVQVVIGIRGLVTQVLIFLYPRIMCWLYLSMHFHCIVNCYICFSSLFISAHKLLKRPVKTSSVGHFVVSQCPNMQWTIDQTVVYGPEQS